jgi:hypothetical protein
MPFYLRGTARPDWNDITIVFSYIKNCISPCTGRDYIAFTEEVKRKMTGKVWYFPARRLDPTLRP